MHPRALPQITPSFFPSNVGVQASVETLDSAGQPIAVWSTVRGLGFLPCRVSPVAGIQERYLAERIGTEADTVILIVGRYADVITTTSGVTVDGIAYDVVAVDEDSLGATTRVIARRRT